MRIRCLLYLAVLFAPLVTPRPADAAVITYNARLNCDSVEVEGIWWHKVYYSGSVTFSNPDHRLVLVTSHLVQPGGEINVGFQNNGFGNPPGTSTYQWARCADVEWRPAGSGPHSSRDNVFRNSDGGGGGAQYVGEGTLNWNP